MRTILMVMLLGFASTAYGIIAGSRTSSTSPLGIPSFVTNNSGYNNNSNYYYGNGGYGYGNSYRRNGTDNPYSDDNSEIANGCSDPYETDQCNSNDNSLGGNPWQVGNVGNTGNGNRSSSSGNPNYPQ